MYNVKRAYLQVETIYSYYRFKLGGCLSGYGGAHMRNSTQESA